MYSVGTLPSEQSLKLKPDVKPVIIANCRVLIVSCSLLKKELNRMMKQGVITPMSEPTPWVSQTVLVEKKNGAT